MDIIERYAVVTAYHKEPDELVRRCLRSVAAQQVRCEHFLIADGHPQPWLDEQPVRHIVLDREHNDYGNTPRGVGALLAICEGFDGLCFLDADNWLEPDHVAACITSAASTDDCDFVQSKRTFRRPDASVLPVDDELYDDFTDTNCLFFLPGSFHMLQHFAIAPKEFAPIGDRIFSRALKHANLRRGEVDHATVNYHCNWASIYISAGEEPPPGAKPNINSSRIWSWLSSQDRRQLEIISRRTGVRFP